MWDIDYECKLRVIYFTVRLEMDYDRLTTTQDMFLERVGITNSFNDDNEFRFEPFFVSKYILILYQTIF